MRVSLPLMLIASLALHVSLATGIALTYFHVLAKPSRALSEATTPVVLLFASEKTPSHLAPPIAAPKPPAPAIISAAPVALAAPLPSAIEKALPLIAPSRPLFGEINPNAHVHALPPDAVLNPNPAPHLNGAEGVVFVLDISGSMYEPYAGTTRLAVARQNLSRQIRALKDGTPFAVTLYALTAYKSGPLVAASPATREAAVRFLNRDVDCGGGTNLPIGLITAMQLQAGSLVLASDGDLNSPASILIPETLAILGTKEHCPALTIVGIAPRQGTGDEQILQALADQQGGNYNWVEAGDDSAPELVTSAANATKPASATP